MPADAAASSPSVPDLQQRIEMLEADLRARTAERNEAVEQQAATTEVLRVINASAGNLQPVFDTIVEHAMTLCDAAFGMFGTFDGQHLQTVATRGVPEAFVQFRLSNPPEYGTETGPGRLIAGEAYVHDIDVADSEAYRIGDPNRRAIVDLGGARTILSVALRDDEALLGTLSVYRQEVRPFSDNQIALLKRFADQAVIAMKNAHLLEEQREALAQQTATVEVLRVINSSPANLDPVFGAMLESATRLCNAAFGILWLCEGESFHAAALHGVPERYADIARVPVRPRPNNPLGRMLRGERVIVSLDAADDELYRAGDPVRRALVDAGGARSFIQVALVKDETLLGSLTVYRTEVRAFSEKQITMLKSFAAQAVIAIENARLLSELRHRTDDLTESLEYQTATSEVLDAIGRSTSNIQPVLDKMLSAALRLCRTESGGIAVQQGGVFRYIAILGWDPEADKAFRSMEGEAPLLGAPWPTVGWSKSRTWPLIRSLNGRTWPSSRDGIPHSASR
jgi:GAF domain-containing protein